MQTSSYLEEIGELIDSIRAKPLSREERKKMSLEMAAALLREANRLQTPKERKEQKELSKWAEDLWGKAFLVDLTDQCFRSPSFSRSASQVLFLIEKYGIPKALSIGKKLQLLLARSFSKVSPFVGVSLIRYALRKQTQPLILPAEKKSFEEHLQKRATEAIGLNINQVGEAILSEAEAKRRLALYLEDLKNPLITSISVKISTLYSQINLIAWEKTVEILSERLRLLYQTALAHPYRTEGGEEHPKWVHLDMEEYKDVHLTLDVFKRVLSQPEFFHLSAGIVLQAYLPDAFALQQELTKWAQIRLKEGGAPIRLRLVKGANLAMEQWEASCKGWPQAPYLFKGEVDANYKRMMEFGCILENARAVSMGIATHNIFDIVYALLLRAENGVEGYVHFEMLEGMASSIRKALQTMNTNLLLYCPVARKEHFSCAIAYLIRRFDETMGAENFLKYLFSLKPGTSSWESQTELFEQSCEKVDQVELDPRRGQNRNLPIEKIDRTHPFENEVETDFSLLQNRLWAASIAERYTSFSFEKVPLSIGGKEVQEGPLAKGVDPSRPNTALFSYTLGTLDSIQIALDTAKQNQTLWKETPFQLRCESLHKVADLLRNQRGLFIGLMMANTAKIFSESDAEIAEAIDFAVYYRKQMEKLSSTKDLSFLAKGTILILSPWNFPLSIPLGGIAAALVSGNCVIFKPAPEAILVGWHLAKLFWEAGIPKEVLQFLPLADEPETSQLIQSPQVDGVILTGPTKTAEHLLQLNPSLSLSAETGGKNAMILTDLCDRDLAIKDLLYSAFSHAGQKGSAASLAIVEKGLYDDPSFQRQLREAAASLQVGSAYDLNTSLPPLICPPSSELYRGLTQLEEGEEWLLKPQPDPNNPHLWSPGIKVGVKVGSFTQTTELFGPLLGLLRAENLEQGIQIANHTPYGLTAGLHSLDEREQAVWSQKIEAGNLYINRPMTGAIVKRQPFGGYKKSSFGNAFKAGGPNYLLNFVYPKQVALPKEKAPVNESVNQLTYFLESLNLSAEELGEWYATISNYSYWWNKLRTRKDPTKMVGQDNFFYYVPRKNITLRFTSLDPPLDALKVCAAALTCGVSLEVSWNRKEKKELDLSNLVPMLKVIDEEEALFLQRVPTQTIQTIRLLHRAPTSFKQIVASSGGHILDAPPLMNGRWELLHYLREVSLSINYHRYGNLGLREEELRRPIL